MIKQTLQRAAWALLGIALCLSYGIGYQVASAGDVTSGLFPNADEALKKAITRGDAPTFATNTSSSNSEGWANSGCGDETRWRRTACTSDGVLATTEGGADTWEVSRTTIGTSCTAVPATQLTGVMTTCVYNESSINIVCDDDSTCTTSTGTTIAAGTEACFPTRDRVYCVAASSQTASSTEYGQ